MQALLVFLSSAAVVTLSLAACSDDDPKGATSGSDDDAGVSSSSGFASSNSSGSTGSSSGGSANLCADAYARIDARQEQCGVPPVQVDGNELEECLPNAGANAQRVAACVEATSCEKLASVEGNSFGDCLTKEPSAGSDEPATPEATARCAAASERLLDKYTSCGLDVSNSSASDSDEQCNPYEADHNEGIVTCYEAASCAAVLGESAPDASLLSDCVSGVD